MHLFHHLPKHVTHAGLSAVKMVALAGNKTNQLSDLQRQLMMMVQKYILNTKESIDALDEISVEQLKAAFQEQPPEVRTQFVQGLVIISLMEEVQNKAQAELVKKFSDALSVDQSIAKAYSKLVHKQRFLFGYDVVRHMYVGDMVADAWHKEKFKGLFKIVGAFKGFHTDEKLAAKYQALGLMPEGTLGRALWTYYRRNKFPIPGEKYGAPENIVHHDLSHILGGYDTDPQGELKVASFTAGYIKDCGFWVLLFVICQFHLGIQVAPVTDALKIELDPQEMMRHLARGTLMNTDLFDDWDYWPLLEKTVDEVREMLNVVPLDQVDAIVAKENS